MGSCFDANKEIYDRSNHVKDKETLFDNLVISKTKILLGPVIGLVTHSTARVCVELTGDVNLLLTGILESDNLEVHRSKVKLLNNTVIVFTFSLLKPETLYEFSIKDGNGVVDQIPSSFKTLATTLTDKPFSKPERTEEKALAQLRRGEDDLARRRFSGSPPLKPVHGPHQGEPRLATRQRSTPQLPTRCPV